MKKNEYIIVFLSFLVVIILLFGVIAFLAFKTPAPPTSSTCENCLGEKALVHIDVVDWLSNPGAINEIVFVYRFYNFGDKKAKDVVVTCELFDKEGVVNMIGFDDLGDVNLKSSLTREFVTELPAGFNFEEEYSGECYVKNCDDCDILYKKIPILEDIYKN